MKTANGNDAPHEPWGAALLAVAGTTTGLFFTIWSNISDTTKNQSYWWVLFAIMVVSLASALAVNALSIRDIRNARKESQAARTRYENLRKHLAPPLTEGLDNLLRKSVERVISTAKGGVAEKDVGIFVFVFLRDRYRVVSSTLPSPATTRRIALTKDEGVVGLASQEGVPIIAELLPDRKGKVTYASGNAIAVEPRALSPENLEKVDSSLKWIFAVPICANKAGEIANHDVLGVLSIDCSNDTGGQLFHNREFQNIVEELATQLIPHIQAMKILGVLND